MVMKGMSAIKEKFNKFAKPEKKSPQKHGGTPLKHGPLENPFDKGGKKDQW